MKHSIVAIVMILMCCVFCSQSAYAMPGLTKDCPQCVGGRVRNWYGGVEACENCGGDGRVINWVGVVTVVGLGLAFLGKEYGSKK